MGEWDFIPAKVQLRNYVINELSALQNQWEFRLDGWAYWVDISIKWLEQQLRSSDFFDKFVGDDRHLDNALSEDDLIKASIVLMGKESLGYALACEVINIETSGDFLNLNELYDWSLDIENITGLLCHDELEYA